MSKIARDPLYHRHRFPAEIIAHAVWLAVIRFFDDGLNRRHRCHVFVDPQ